MLNIVEVKKADVPTCLQDVLDKQGLTSVIREYVEDFDLTKYDLSSISFKSDADIYASMAQQIYIILETVIKEGFDAPFFGKHDAMVALVEIYEISLDTTLVKVVADKVLSVASEVAGAFDLTVNENDEEVLINIANFLYGLVDLGVVGADAIDFTDKDTIDVMIQSVYNIVTIPEEIKVASLDTMPNIDRKSVNVTRVLKSPELVA